MNAVIALAAATSRFVDNGDGTISDTSTGLMWSKDDASNDGVTHEEAAKACAALSLGGHSDWRLPTAEELFNLADRSRFDPAIDTEAFPSCKSDWYWTSTPWAPSPSDCAWIVYFLSGRSGSDGRDLNSRVRAVRGPSGQ